MPSRRPAFCQHFWSHASFRALLVAFFAMGFVAWAPGLAPAVARADEPARDVARREQARALFRLGVGLYNEKDIGGAADAFLASHRAFPSAHNAINAGVCLDALGRYDEALDHFEEALVRFDADLSPEERALTTRAIPRLEKAVATVVVSSNVAGTVVVDGRERAKLPLTMPLRLLPGTHRVRVVQSGYATFERDVVLRVGANPPLDAPLALLGDLGALRVESADGRAARVLVDGIGVGDAPWEGPLPVGPHVVQIADDAECSPLVPTTVVLGQTTLTRPSLVAAARALHVRGSPFSALLFVDGVPVGRGAWQGRVPAGRHAIVVREEGYVSKNVDVDVAPSSLASELRVNVDLVPDERHPRWKAQSTPPPGRPFLALGLAGALAPTLRGSADQRCGEGCDVPIAVGGLALLRAGYELRRGIAFEVSGGVLALYRRTQRTWDERYPLGAPEHTARFTATERAWLRGALILGGASFGLPLGRGFALRPRLAVGALLGSVEADLEASVVNPATGERSAALVTGASGAASTAPFVAEPGLHLEWSTGAVRLGVGLDALFVLGAGPSRGIVAVIPAETTCSEGTLGKPGCAPASEHLTGPGDGYASHGPFVVLLPTFDVRFDL